jgi:phage tail-like protein
LTMPARDSNDATFYVLRYAEDFTPVSGAANDSSAPFGSPSSPYLDPALLFDWRRGVLELQPEASPFAADPPRGIAIDPNGDVYRVDDDGVLMLVRCDGSSSPLICEPNVLAQPAGLALDRRGYLYIADPAAARVVVYDPGSRAVVAILWGGGPVGLLSRPVDVAIAPSGLIFVADAEAGRIAIFSAAMQPVGWFATAAAPGKAPTPISVMIAPDDSVLVADAWLPRLLNYAPDGTRLPDLDISTLVASLAGGAIALGAYELAYGVPPPRFVIGRCGPCETPEDDGPRRLAEVHRALRLLALTLGRRFEAQGIYISRALDSGRPGTDWHRISVEFNGPLPEGTSVVVDTFTAESTIAITPTWSGTGLTFTSDVPEQLVQSPPGRFLWVRVTLSSADQLNTPSVNAIRVWYPRVSYLDLLPAVYRRDPESALFLEHYLALFEHIFTGIEDRWALFNRQLNPDVAPMDVIDWLAALIDLAFDPSWALERRRALVREAMALYRMRGTVAGIERYVEIYTGVRPAIVEDFLERPSQPAFLGRPGSVLGCALPLLSCGAAAAPGDDVLWSRYAHRFTIFAYTNAFCDSEVILAAVDRIVEVNKPAHTVHRTVPVYSDARVGVQSRVGLDLVLGAPAPMMTQLGGCLDDGCEPDSAHTLSDTGGVLGTGTILGSRRAGYVSGFNAPGMGVVSA